MSSGPCHRWPRMRAFCATQTRASEASCCHLSLTWGTMYPPSTSGCRASPPCPLIHTSSVGHMLRCCLHHPRHSCIASFQAKHRDASDKRKNSGSSSHHGFLDTRASLVVGGASRLVSPQMRDSIAQFSVLFSIILHHIITLPPCNCLLAGTGTRVSQWRSNCGRQSQSCHEGQYFPAPKPLAD